MESPYKVGNNVILKTVTDYYVGRILMVGEEEIVLVEASWVADTGRWSVALATGFDEDAEIEPCMDPVVVNRKALTAGTLWRHALPKSGAAR